MAHSDPNNRPEIGPAITYTGGKMAKLASKTEWVETTDGIRRLVVEGAPVPAGVGLEDQMSGDDVDPSTLTRPVVDEEASKPHPNATQAGPGVSLDNVEAAASGGRSRGSGRAAKPSSGSDS